MVTRAHRLGTSRAASRSGRFRGGNMLLKQPLHLLDLLRRDAASAHIALPRYYPSEKHVLQRQLLLRIEEAKNLQHGFQR